MNAEQQAVIGFLADFTAAGNRRETIRLIKSNAASLLSLITSLEADARRLDFLESKSDGSSWVARESVTGRGYRLHNNNVVHDGNRPTARQAIDAAMKGAV